MTWHASPGIDSSGGMWSGGGKTPWWGYPPTGPPKSQIPYGSCYVDRKAPNGETWEQPYPCEIWWPWSEHKMQHEEN